MKLPARLPDPTQDEIAISSVLAAQIAEEIRIAGGFLGFERFMELALYAPGQGYYVAGAHKFGAAGDFVTAPEVSPLFGACLARQCAAVAPLGGQGIIEFGGGSGRLAIGLLTELRRLGIDHLPYAIVELSPELQARQQALIAAEAPDLLAHVQWWRGPPVTPWDGVIIANEILDALPTIRFEISGGHILEQGVGLDDHGAFDWRLRPATVALADSVRAALPESPETYPDGFRSEINPRQSIWLAHLSGFLRRGVVVLADYGYPRAEYYHPDRDDGTLQCYYRHRVHADPFWFPGVQDLTAAVDFSALAAAAEVAGFAVMGFAEQAQYLIACGITDLLAAFVEEHPAAGYRATQAVKTLLLPQEMGTRVKFMTLARNYDGAIVGHNLRDARHRL